MTKINNNSKTVPWCFLIYKGEHEKGSSAHKSYCRVRIENKMYVVVNEPIYDDISYFILILTWSTTN